jgi:hypothetical protein
MAFEIKQANLPILIHRTPKKNPFLKDINDIPCALVSAPPVRVCGGVTEKGCSCLSEVPAVLQGLL